MVRNAPRSTRRITFPEKELGVPAGDQHRILRPQRNRRRTVTGGELVADRAGLKRTGGDRAGDEVHGADEAGNEGGLRVSVDLGGRADLLDPAGVHHRDRIGERERLLLIVRDEDGGQAEPPLNGVDLVAEADPQMRVEAGEGLVHEQDLRLQYDAAGDRHALLLAARELGRIALPQPGESDQVEDGGDLPPHLRRRRLAELQAEGDVALDRHMRPEGMALEDHARRPAIGRQVDDARPVDADVAAVGDLESAEKPEKRRFPAAGRSKQADERAVGDVEGDLVDRGDVSEPFRQIEERYVRQRYAPANPRHAPKPAAMVRALRMRRAKSMARNDGTQRSTERTAPYWMTSWLLISEIIRTGMVRIFGAPIRKAPSVS